MKNKKVILFAASLFMMAALVKAQTPNAPGYYKLEKAADYTNTESQLKQYVAWYESAPLTENEDLHQQIGKFILKWIDGSPNVTVNIGGVAGPILNEKNYQYSGDLLVVYMGGIAVFELNNPNEKDETKIETAGVEAVLALYKSNTDLLKDSKAIKKYKKLQDKGELQKWISDIVAKMHK